MQIRRKHINECKGQPKLQKALAFAILLKYKLGRSSLMQNYSINKVHTLTNVSATAIKKYMPILIENGWVSFCGKNKQHLVVRKFASHTKTRNICVDKFCFKSFKDVYYSLRAFLVLIIQSHKDFIKRTLQIATNPKRGQNFKAARKLVKRLVKQGILKSVFETYKEYGLSFKRIAKETGNCARTAQRIMQYAVNKKWVEKQNHYEKVNSTNFYCDYYTFYKNGKLYKVYANTYELSSAITKSVACNKMYW